jgi:hypothetical protein
LESPPLCSWCENATDGLLPWEILRIGLENVAKKDGESKAYMLRRTKSKDKAPLRQATKTLTKGQRQAQRCEYEPEFRINLPAGAAEMGIGGIGNADRTSHLAVQ